MKFGHLKLELDNYYFPEQSKERLTEFVDYYNNRRYHESLQNLTPADVYFRRGARILKQRKIIKQKTMMKRKKTWLSQVLDL